MARARWLGEVAASLEDAERLLNRFRLAGCDGAGIIDLELRIGAAKREVHSLRAGRRPSESDPKWSSLATWGKSG
jgi:hypothetical protein